MAFLVIRQTHASSRSMRQFEMMSSVLPSATGKASISPIRNSTLVTPRLAAFARRRHVRIHICWSAKRAFARHPPGRMANRA